MRVKQAKKEEEERQCDNHRRFTQRREDIPLRRRDEGKYLNPLIQCSRQPPPWPHVGHACMRGEVMPAVACQGA